MKVERSQGDGVEGRNREARERILRSRGDPLFVADWMRAVFLHYEVDRNLLGSVVPFELDLWEGERAYVSLVAFTMQRMRPSWGGEAAKWLLMPIATHDFLNVRAYVRCGGEQGIYFLREWLNNRVAAHLGPPAFGLPYRYGRTRYEHRPEDGYLAGEVVGNGRVLRYEGEVDMDAEYREVGAGSVDAFLLERYSAFTCLDRRRVRRRFRVWHEPWLQVPVAVEVESESLLRGLGAWAEEARLVGAHYSPGVRGVWMGWPKRVA